MTKQKQSKTHIDLARFTMRIMTEMSVTVKIQKEEKENKKMEENKKVIEEVNIEKDSVDKARADVIIINVDKKPNLFVATVDKAKNLVGKMPKGLKTFFAVAGTVGGAIAGGLMLRYLFRRRSDEVLDGNFEELMDSSEEDFVSSDETEE